MSRALAALVLAALIVAGGSSRLEEDHPAWDCERMGNLSCGATP